MLGTYFYHEILRKTVVAFGTLFNDIHIQKENKAGATISDLKVPLAYGPRSKFLAKLEQQQDLNKPTAISLPRMSFEMSSLAYDGSRKTSITKSFKAVDNGGNVKKVFLPVPYNVGFELNIMCKLNDDALQIIEQILPFFQPQFSMTVDLIPEMNEKRDIPIILESIDFTDDYEGDYSTRRYIYYTLRFSVKTYMYGPVAANDIIRKSILDTKIGSRDTNARVMEYNVTPKALEDKNNDGTINAADDALLQPDDDFGFNEGITYHGQ